MKNYYNKSEKAVNVLYVKEPGPGKLYEVEVLRTIPLVKDIIIAEYSAIDKNPINLHNLVDFYLAMADCIFIAGSAYDPSQHYSISKTTRIAPTNDRETFEIALINAAKKHGIPILAVCAGSWRLTNAYGALTHALPEDKVPYHERWEAARTPDELINIKSGSMLSGIHIAAQQSKEILYSYNGKAQKNLGTSRVKNSNFNPEYLKVNTTHWRVSPSPETQHGTEFNFLFETAAKSVEHDTLEFYESKYGVPIYAKQFHSEYTIPEARLKDGKTVVVDDYKTHRCILEAFVENGLTFSRKRELLKVIPDNYESRKRLSSNL